MWAEIIFSRDDIARLLAQALPVTIHFDEDAKTHTLTLHDLSEVTLVPDVGLRVVCQAQVHWPVLGIDVPIGLKSLTVLLLPTIGEGEQGDSLVFRVSIEEADFTALPAVVDRGITAAINAKLAEKHAELSWNFSRALTTTAALPDLLSPLESFTIRPAWGKVRVTEEAVVYAASFHSAFVRKGEAPIDEPPRPTAEPASPPPRATTPNPPAATAPNPSAAITANGAGARDAIVSGMVLAGAMGVAAGFTYLALRGARSLSGARMG